MSAHTLIRRSLGFAFALTLAGSAFARRPNALVEAQANADRVLSTCADTGVRGTDGYRNMLAYRAPEGSSTEATASTPLRRMGDHVVLVCAGGRVHGSGGYRDVDVRLRVEDSTLLVAQFDSDARLVAARECPSR